MCLSHTLGRTITYQTSFPIGNNCGGRWSTSYIYSKGLAEADLSQILGLLWPAGGGGGQVRGGQHDAHQGLVALATK